jgi:flagellar basal-body rod modification protein FlgD
MAINGVQSTGTGSIAGTNASRETLGKDDFLRLLVAQLQAQNPLNPMDSTAFTAQLAQFSSLEELQNLNKGLNELKSSQASVNSTLAVSYMGKTVKAVGNSFEVTGGAPNSALYALPSDAVAVYTYIYDGNGNLVDTAIRDATPRGEYPLDWDGTDSQGNSLPDDSYTFEILATDVLGRTTQPTGYTSGTVSGVTYRDGAAYLLLGSREIPVSNVVLVAEPQEGQG